MMEENLYIYNIIDVCNVEEIKLSILFLPVKPGVRAASFLAKLSEVKLESSFRGLMCTLKMEALPLISGGPAVERQAQRRRIRGQEQKGGREFYSTQMKMMRSICSEAHKIPSVYKTPPDVLSLPATLSLYSLAHSPSVFHIRKRNVPLSQLC